jgi:hypothetical protein
MPLQSDKQFKTSWPANTTPQAPDGSGAKSVTLAGYSLTNVNASARFVKFYDTSTSPTVGNTVPVRTIQLPGSSTAQADFHRGKIFLNGMWISVTAIGSDADNTAPAANDVLVTIDYQP